MLSSEDSGLRGKVGMAADQSWRRLGQDTRQSCDVTTPTEGGGRQVVGLERVDGSGAAVGGGEEAEIAGGGALTVVV